MKTYRIKIDDMFYVKTIIFGTDPLFQIIPTWEISEAAIYEEEKAKKYCDELNNQKENQEAELKFTLEEVGKRKLSSNDILKVILQNPSLPIYGWVASEVVEDDGCCRWLGKLSSAEVRKFAIVEPYNCYDNTIIFKDDYEEYLEYLLNKGISEEDAMDTINNLDYKKAIFVDVDLPDV